MVDAVASGNLVAVLLLQKVRLSLILFDTQSYKAVTKAENLPPEFCNEFYYLGTQTVVNQTIL